MNTKSDTTTVLYNISPLLGSYLNFDDRISCSLSNKCFEYIHHFREYHEWKICEGSGLEFDPVRKFTSLLRLKPCLKKITIFCDDVISKDKLLNFMKNVAIKKISVSFLCDCNIFIDQFEDYNFSSDLEFDTIRLHENTHTGELFLKILEKPIVKYKYLNLICKTPILLNILKTDISISKSRLDEIIIFDNDFRDSNIVLSISELDKLRECQNIILHTNNKLHGNDILFVATKLWTKNLFNNTKAIIDEISWLSICKTKRLSNISFYSLMSTNIIQNYPDFMNSFLACIPLQSKITFFDCSLTDPNLYIIVKALQPHNIIFRIENDNSLKSICGLITWYKLKKIGIRVDLNGILEIDIPSLSKLYE